MVSKPKYEDVLRQMPLKTPQFSQSIKEFGDVDTCALRKFAIHRARSRAGGCNNDWHGDKPYDGL
jgi:hypothetical protein